MEKTIPNLVIVPDNYGNQQAQYSVLYLLHGAYGDHTDWLTKYPAIKSYADTYNLIIVCPNGGYNSWYVDSPIDETMNYETYVAIELVEAIDDRYNTVKDKAGRAITGLSMGGHGAFYLAFRHQDIWGAAGSMSGGMDLRPFPKNWDIPKRLGDYANHKDNWEQSSVVNLIYLLDGKELALIFDCGTDDFFFGVNQRMHQKLLERNIPHDYIERPGDHNWDYWGNAIRYQLLFFSEYFQG
ncbi:MAG: alpha/beta hydrolase family protein [Bacteroidota bacterium]